VGRCGGVDHNQKNTRLQKEKKRFVWCSKGHKGEDGKKRKRLGEARTPSVSANPFSTPQDFPHLPSLPISQQRRQRKRKRKEKEKEKEKKNADRSLCKPTYNEETAARSL
jgi:hypothetical protein